MVNYMKRKITISSSEEMINLGYKIGSRLEANMVLALEGDLGAGKTTMTKGIAKGLDITEVINSPTFTIMKIHEGRLTLYHMDVYRLSNDSGDDDLEEFLYQGGVTVIEWASNFPNILPEEYLLINIFTNDDATRTVVLEANSPKYDEIIRGIEC